MQQPRTVYLIDDDPSVRAALNRLLRVCGLDVQAFESVDAFLAKLPTATNSCVVADIRLPGTDGLELPALLADRDLEIPVIFLTAQDTEETRGAARRAGAAGYFRKPVDDQALLDAIEWALSGADVDRETNDRSQ